MKHFMQVFGQFSSILGALSVHLVEASPAMSRIQGAALTGMVQNTISLLHYCILFYTYVLLEII